MYDKVLVHAILTQIAEALKVIQTRFSHVNTVDDLTDSPKGAERLDGLCMLFIAVGEAFKNLDKITKGSLLVRYPEIDWKGVMGFRDIIAHHYFDIDAEQVYWVCKNHVPDLSSVVELMLQDDIE